MKVNVASILNTKGASIDAAMTVDGESLFPESAEDGSKAPEFSEPIKVRVRLTNTGRYIVARGSVETRVSLKCSRCLDEFSESIRVSLEEEFCRDVPGDVSRDSPGEERAEEPFDDDGEKFWGDSVDLSDVVRQGLLVALPMKSLCDPDCKGICPVCGVNMNEGSCTCERGTLDPRLSVLGELFKSKQ